MKILVPAAIAAVAGLFTVIQSAEAASCGTSGFTPWTQISTCPAPNQNRGNSQGTGSAGSQFRRLSIQVAPRPNINGTARGFRSNFTSIAGCTVSTTAGGFNQTPFGACNEGQFHKVTINF